MLPDLKEVSFYRLERSYIQDRSLLFYSGDSQWSNWSEWSEISYLTDQKSWIKQNLTVASCMKTNMTRTRKCINLSHGRGKECQGTAKSFNC